MKTLRHNNLAFWVTLIVSICLFVAGFFVPPMGEIDGSVLKAVGMLLGFSAFSQVPAIIASGKEVHIQHGQTSVSVGDGVDLMPKKESEGGDE